MLRCTKACQSTTAPYSRIFSHHPSGPKRVLSQASSHCCAFFARDAAAMVEANQHTLVLVIVQQRLVLSKTNDGWGFELLLSIVLRVPLCVPFFRLRC